MAKKKAKPAEKVKFSLRAVRKVLVTETVERRWKCLNDPSLTLIELDEKRLSDGVRAKHHRRYIVAIQSLTGDGEYQVGSNYATRSAAEKAVSFLVGFLPRSSRRTRA